MEIPMPQRDAVFPAGRQALYEINGYSAAIRSGDLLFVSGQVGSREDGSAEPDFEQQVELDTEHQAIRGIHDKAYRRHGARAGSSRPAPG